MSHVRIVRLFSVLVLAFWASTVFASAITYAVGTCRPGLRSFHAISRALAATPPADFVEVCPGTYRDQLQITHPVTLEGVSNGTSAQAIIAPPAGGLVINAMDDAGNPVAAQLWVNNASGPVNIIDLAVDGSGNGVLIGQTIVGIFYQNSSGTVNRVATRNQSGTVGGVGIWVEGGSSNPLVTIENSSVHDYDFEGLEVETNFAAPKLTAVIKGNDVTTSVPFTTGILIGGGAVTVTSNLIVNAGSIGIFATAGSAGLISANTVVNAPDAGIIAGADGISVTSNNIFGSATGIEFFMSVPTIQGNTITNSRVGIDFVCNADPNVHSNIINDVGTALKLVPSAIATSNKYFNVGTIRTGGC